MEPVSFDKCADETERWFVDRGLPHFIDGYSFTGDIFTRAAPMLAFLMFVEVFLTFGDDYEGWGQLGMFLLGLGVLLAAVVAVNRARGRRAFALPDEVRWPEIAAFVLVPPLIRFLVDREIESFLGLVVVQLVLLGLVSASASYGLLPMTRWSIAHFASRVRNLGGLLVRVLPLMVVFSLFLFVNAEVWQVANDLPGLFLALVLGGFALIIVAFVALSLLGELDGVGRLGTWREVAERVRATPVEVVARVADEPASAVPFTRRARVNMSLLLFLSRLVPVLLVSAGVFGVYVGFGLLAIREQTILQWIASDELAVDDVLWETTWAGADIVLTRHLLYVSSIIAAVSGLQFAVTLVTDPTADEQFAGEVTSEVREAVAVRAVYLTEVSPRRSNGSRGARRGA